MVSLIVALILAAGGWTPTPLPVDDPTSGPGWCVSPEGDLILVEGDWVWVDGVPLFETPRSFDHPAIAVSGGILYVFGGYSSSIYAANEGWAFDGFDWWQTHGEKTIKLRTKQFYLVQNGRTATTLDDGRILLVGPTTRADVYSPAMDSWATAPAFPGGTPDGLLAYPGATFVGTRGAYSYE